MCWQPDYCFTVIQVEIYYKIEDDYYCCASEHMFDIKFNKDIYLEFTSHKTTFTQHSPFVERLQTLFA